MKRIKIRGGLGNQMFQYAHGRNLMISDREDVVFDTSFFTGCKKKNETDRPLLLKNFKLNNIAKFMDNPESFVCNFLSKIASKISGDYGTYQSEQCFNNIEEIIRSEFTLKEHPADSAKKTEDKIKLSPNSISIHIRRGDYVLDKKTNAYHGTCELDYYVEAMDIMKEKTGSPTFFVFSDDINWVKENLKIENAIYVSNPEIKDYEELILMSKCKHHIIANSSFSWWGAWLNPNPDKIIIGPKQWTTKKTSDELGILPKSWIQI